MGRPRVIHIGPGGVAEEEAIEACLGVLSEGGLALLPAEGLYGLHARAGDERAYERLLAAKGLSQPRPFIVLLPTPGQVDGWASVVPAAAKQLIESVWPGPLTLVLRARTEVPEPLRPEGLVALRCPGSGFLRKLMSRLGSEIVSTSANRASEPPPADLEEVDGEILDAVQIAVDAGRLAGLGSTVVGFGRGGRPHLLRRGLWVPPSSWGG